MQITVTKKKQNNNQNQHNPEQISLILSHTILVNKHKSKMEARGIPTKSSHKDCQNQRAFVVGCWSCSEANDGWVRLVVGGDVVPLWWSMEGCITESGTNHMGNNW